MHKRSIHKATKETPQTVAFETRLVVFLSQAEAATIISLIAVSATAAVTFLFLSTIVNLYRYLCEYFVGMMTPLHQSGEKDIVVMRILNTYYFLISP